MEPPLVCHQCSMKFNSIGQLSKHREKFCVGSYMPYQDKPYILREWNLADDKIRQLNAIKEAYARRSEESREWDRHIINQSRNSGKFSPHHKPHRTYDDGFGSSVPIDIVEQLVRNQSSDRPQYDMRNLEDTYGRNIPAQIVRQILRRPVDSRGVNYEVKKLDEDYSQAMEGLKQTRHDLQKSSSELQRQLSALRKQSANTDDDSDLNPYLDHPTDGTQRHVIEDLRSQVNALRMQINSQPNPVQSYHPMATYSPTQTQPLPQQYPTGFDFKGGSLVAEISALRQHYINMRADPSVISQLTQMLNEAEQVEERNKARPSRQAPPPQAPVSQLPSSLLSEELYAMEAENYRLQRELIRLEQNNANSDSTDIQLSQLHKEHLNKLLQLEREIDRVRAKPVERNIPTNPDNPLLYNRLPSIPNRRYDAAEGFTCYYDFIMGLEPPARCCKLVVGLYNRVAELGEPSVLPAIHTEQTVKGTSAMIGARQPVPRCPASPELGLVVELQTSDSSPEQLRTRAWLKLDLFDNNRNLRSGAWKVPFYFPPIIPEMSTSELLSRPRYETAELYLRVVNNKDTGSQSAASISPANHIDYQLAALNYPDANGSYAVY